MKGMVFTEFLEMVEEKFGFEVADQIVSEAELASGGSYTAVGTYDHQEMVALVVNLSRASGLPVPDLLHAFGVHLFGRFSLLYGRFFSQAGNAFDFLAGIDNYIHVEVRKLYPDAELPSFRVRREEGRMELEYASSRKLGDFARGLLDGCFAHFQEAVDIRTELLSEDGSRMLFTITRLPA